MAEEGEAAKGYSAGAGADPLSTTAFGGDAPANAPDMEIMSLDEMLKNATELSQEFLLSEVVRWNKRIKRYQDENRWLVDKNARLAEDVEKARLDKLDIIEHLRDEEKKKKFELADLQRELATTIETKDEKIAYLENLEKETRENSNEKIEALTEQIYSVEMQLDTLKKFEQEKGSMDAELKTLNEAIMREQIQHREAIKSLNRHWAIEKDRRDKEEKKAIAKAKQEMLEIQDQHISDVTRRAIDDNNELQLEIAFQSKQAKELLAQNGAYTANAVQLRRDLEVQMDAEKALAQKNCSYQQTIKALLAKMKGVEGENAKLKGEVEAVVVAGGSVARGPSAMSESSAFSDTRVEDMEREELEKKLTKLKRDGRAAREMVKRLQGKLKSTQAIMDEAGRFIMAHGESANSRPNSRGLLPPVRGSSRGGSTADDATKLYIKIRQAID